VRALVRGVHDPGQDGAPRAGAVHIADLYSHARRLRRHAGRPTKLLATVAATCAPCVAERGAHSTPQRSAHRLPLTRRALLRIGVLPIVDHYYEPRFRYDAPPGRAPVAASGGTTRRSWNCSNGSRTPPSWWTARSPPGGLAGSPTRTATSARATPSSSTPPSANSGRRASWLEELGVEVVRRPVESLDPAKRQACGENPYRTLVILAVASPRRMGQAGT
jgi:hypothetical protein